MIVTLLIITALPGVVNIYCIAGYEWWRMSSNAANYFEIIPDWWENIYPITYFFLGKYLREFPLKLKVKPLAVLTVVVFFLGGIFNYYRSYGNTFVAGVWTEYGSLLITLQTVLLFSFFVKIKYDKLPVIFNKTFSKISELSLGAYLTSYVFDRIVYTRLIETVPEMYQKLIWFPVVVVIILAGSIFCSYIIDLTYSCTLKKTVSRITK